MKASKLSRGISFTYDEDSPTKQCFCQQFPDEFDNTAVDLMTCTFEEPSRVVPVRKCSIDTGDKKWSECAEVFDKDWGNGEQKINEEGRIKLKLRRPGYITGLSIKSGKGHDRWQAVKGLKLQYQTGHYQTKYINRADRVKVFKYWDWSEVLYPLDGDNINVAEGNDGVRGITVTFNPIMTDEIILYISGSDHCMINEVEIYNDCKFTLFYQQISQITSSKDTSEDIPSQRVYLEDKSGRHLVTFHDGSARVAPSKVLSQFKIELVRLDSDHVGLVNAAGYYLSAYMDDLGWYMKSPQQEEIFAVETHGEFVAYRSHDGKYLSVNTDGFLELLTVENEVADPQLFAQQNGETTLVMYLFGIIPPCRLLR